MAAAGAPAELGTRYGDEFDAGLPQKRVGVDIAVIGDHDAGLDGDHVVAIIPLLALGRVSVASRLHDPKLGESQRLGDDVEERPLFEDRKSTRLNSSH